VNSRPRSRPNSIQSSESGESLLLPRLTVLRYSPFFSPLLSLFFLFFFFYADHPEIEIRRLSRRMNVFYLNVDIRSVIYINPRTTRGLLHIHQGLSARWVVKMPNVARSGGNTDAEWRASANAHSDSAAGHPEIPGELYYLWRSALFQHRASRNNGIMRARGTLLSNSREFSAAK
jgi:hypothetical protein